MKATANITIGILLAVVLLVGSTKAASTGELLQQGLYAEEVDGDINAAIKAYEQIITNDSAPRNHVAQALYRQGMCYVKIRDEAAAKTVLEKLVTDYADQAEIVEKAQPILDEMLDFDPAALMPSDTLIYVELGSPGRQVETILNMLKGTPFENPLAAIGGPAGPTGPGQKSPADILAALLNPSMMAEFKKIRSSAIGITGIPQSNQPPMVAVLYPGKSDALRGMIMAGLGMAGQPGEPLEGMQTLKIENVVGVAHDDKIIIIASPPEQLTWSVRQYKGVISEPSLASNNPSFSMIDKKERSKNALTVWGNVDLVYTSIISMFPPGQTPPQILWANAFLDFANIDNMLSTVSIEPDGFVGTDQILFKQGHHCLAYDLIRTPNINTAALEAVPSDAVALVSFALSAQSDLQADTIRVQVKNITGLDIGREIFANIEQVSLFALLPKTPDAFFGAHFGIVLTSHNPQQTRTILETALRTANLAAGDQQSIQTDASTGRYQIGIINGQRLYCYMDQAKNATVLSLNPDITQACIAAINDGSSICKSGPLNAAVSKLSPNASKLIAVNVGGAIRIAAPVLLENMPQEDRESLWENLSQLAAATDKTTFELRTDEQLNSFTSNAALTGLPPLNQLFGPLAQIVQTVEKAKKQAAADEAKRQAGITIKQTAVGPVIDGVADEIWSVADRIKLTNVLESPLSSPNDLSADYRIMWDKDNLYLFADVTDDVLKNDADEEWENDAVEVFIDADNSKTSSYGQNDYQYVFVWDKTSPRIREVKHERTDDIQFAFATTNTGYRAEMKFPWSTLGTKPHVGSKIGLDVHVADNDKGGKRDRKLTWHDKQDNAWQNPQVFANAELAGLLGWWKLDESEGTTVADSSGNGNNGTLQGDPQWRPAEGKIGGAIELDGNGDFVKIANESAFDITGQITIAAWVNISSVPQEWTGIVTKGDSAWRLSTDFANNVFHFGVAEGDYINGQRSVGSNQWHHVAGVYDGSQIKIYVDGKLDASRPRSGPIGTNNFPVCIGENHELRGRYWDGLIDDVRVYNYALSEKEIAALAAAQ